MPRFDGIAFDRQDNQQGYGDYLTPSGVISDEFGEANPEVSEPKTSIPTKEASKHLGTAALDMAHDDGNIIFRALE